MITLAIETSCDETAAAVVRDDGLVMSSIVASQIEIFADLGGVVPELAARAHVEKILPVVEKALKDTGMRWEHIEQVAVTEGPSLIGSLLVGHNTAKALAYAHNKPIQWVDHVRAHVAACWLYEEGEQKPNVKFPAVGLVVSGGHTELLLIDDEKKWKRLGGTRDDAAGEAFDKVGKLLGLPYPGGPHLAQRAESGDPAKYKLPRSWLEQGSLDFSFSGLKTAVLREVKRQEPGTRNSEPGSQNRVVDDLSASFQEAVVDVLVGKTVRAVERQEGIESILLAGGVAANKSLRKRMKQKFGDRLHMPKLKFCTDNAAMVGMVL